VIDQLISIAGRGASRLLFLDHHSRCAILRCPFRFLDGPGCRFRRKLEAV
jgi:hypothetical protein